MYTLSLGVVVGSVELLNELHRVLPEEPVRVAFEQRKIDDWGAFVELLNQARPDILLIDLDHLPEPLEDVVRQIKATAGSPMVIVVHNVADAPTVLRAIRAKADEFLYPPLKDDLHRALQRIVTERIQLRLGTRPRGKTLGLLSAKGGCGATTTACHLAVEIQRQTNLRVLLADYDVYAGMVGFLMKASNRYSVLDAVANVHRLDLSFWKALVADGSSGIQVLAAPTSYSLAIEGNLEGFRDVLRFARANYDWTVVDLGRGVTALVNAVMEELDEFFMVTTTELLCLHKAKEIAHALLRKGYPRHQLHLLLNRVPKRMEVTPEELERIMGVPIYAMIPNDYAALSDAYADGSLLPEKSRLRRSFAHLAAQIAGKGQPETRKESKESKGAPGRGILGLA